jgi:hypothetical protein
MEDNTKKPIETTRRQLLKIGAYGLGAIGAIGLVSRGAEAQVKKATQATVKYQATAKDGKSCATCRHFEAPAACKGSSGNKRIGFWSRDKMEDSPAAGSSIACGDAPRNMLTGTLGGDGAAS